MPSREPSAADAHLRLRLATSADLLILRRWDGDPDVAAASGQDDAFDWEAEIPRSVDWREILIAEVDARPVGVLVVIDAAREESHYWGDADPGIRAVDIWIGDAADRGRGYGSAMMRLALDRCFTAPLVTAVLVDPLASNRRAHRFYQRLGFRPVGQRRFGADECLVHRYDRPA